MLGLPLPSTLNNNNVTMKFIKRTILTILILMTVGLLFRGYIYRHIVTYKSVGQRQNYSVIDDKLIDYIEMNLGDKKDLDIKNIIEIGLSRTSKQLNFTASKNDNDPNKLINSKTAHCVGYSSFYATTCNYLLKKNNLADIWTAKPQIGQIFLFGINIHKYFKSSFFKDHDFVTIENKITGKVFAVDPTINDYLYIDYITYEK